MTITDAVEERKAWNIAGIIAPVRFFFATTSLIVLIALASLFAIALLAATLAQGRLSSVSVNGVSINVWKLDSRSTEWREAIQKIVERRRDLSAYDASRRDLSYNDYAAQAGLARAKTRLKHAVDYIAFRSADIMPNFATELNALDSLEEKVGRILKEEDKIKNTLPTLDTQISGLNNAYDDFKAAEIEVKLALAAREKLEADIKANNEAIQAGETLKDDLIATFVKSPDEATRARIENAFHELTPKPLSVGWFLKFLIVLQPDILSLFLVVSMGILGSSLQIAHSFFRAKQSDSVGSYFLRLGVGAVTALAIFVVGKAGVPIVTDASKFGGDAPINPYFISFLAIVSGLLSERAIVSVQSQGEKLFGPGQGDVRRWVRSDLSPALASQGLAKETMAEYLQLTLGQTKQILEGAEPATSEQQRIIALILRAPMRDLFTDIPLAPSSGSADVDAGPTPT